MLECESRCPYWSGQGQRLFAVLVGVVKDRDYLLPLVEWSRTEIICCPYWSQGRKLFDVLTGVSRTEIVCWPCWNGQGQRL